MVQLNLQADGENMGHWNQVARVKQHTKSMLEGWSSAEGALAGTFWVGGEEMTAADIVGRLTTYRQSHDKVDAAHVALEYAVAQRDAQLKAEQKFQEDLASVLGMKLGPDLERLAKYGVPAKKKRRALTSEEMVVSREKARRTRKARGTKGKRQREAITAEAKPQVVVVQGDGTARTLK